MAKPTVVVVGADKGGVGKTTVARTLLDYFTAHHVPTRAFDTESPKGTLKRFHADITEIVDATSVPDQMRIFDALDDRGQRYRHRRARRASLCHAARCATSAFSTR
jgi:thymidylate kinase